MEGPETDASFHFSGIKKYFNSYTLTGRMNCVLATFRGIALMVLYFKVKYKNTPAMNGTVTDFKLYLICEVPMPGEANANSSCNAQLVR
ncbi:ATP synthase membrane subunit DAPIT, mitochondrial-like [Herpailurus yagouaroundi]|uniref:ATP synthase membrane subunit DAPIT, mitochondrial-like n=1 Tax=Herpailurus yagouaroundi TaxID=1608482 RepID=UPI001AD65C50|nr:ATP synthase membrane subunit DAPIT, mitochondrial-like [Puma yagouaroundi]